MKITPAKNIPILIVDDSSDNIMALEEILEIENVSVYSTTSPKAAEQLCIDHNIAIALIDVKMPEMDGFELLERLKANPETAQLMVVLMTGYSTNSSDVVKGLNKGAADYLFKPLDLYIVQAKVNAMITLISYQAEIIRKNELLENYQNELFEAIKQTEKSKLLKENFLANMSHEIRTPLNGIIGLTGLLKQIAPTDDQQELIRLMDFSSQSLLGIVNDILESAQLDAGKVALKRAKVDLWELINDIYKLTRSMAESKGLSLNCEIDPEVPHFIIADALRLNQILINLINNAIKFTESGTVQIKVRMLDAANKTVQLQFVISDTGRGIPESELKTIFNRFEQVENKSWEKFGGTGLGLAIVKKLAALKGGNIEVNSTVGLGSSFIFTNRFELPDKKHDTPEMQKQPAELSKFHNVRILLAEDNFTDQFMVQKILNDWNIRVDLAENGLEAFEKIKEEDYDLVLMDTHLPLMDGNQATRKIRRELSGPKNNIPILSFSASVMAQEKEEARLAGVNDFVEKPLRPEILYRKISQLLKIKNYKGTRFS